MDFRVITGLAIVIFFVYGAGAVTMTIKNNCPYTIWPATLTGGGAQLSTTGFELATGASNTFYAPPSWSGRLWARTGCSSAAGKFTCATADCASGQVACNGGGAIPPASLVEFTLNGAGGNDFYDISLVDGFNLPVAVAPQSGGCTTVSCAANINADCPEPLRVRGGSAVIACKSACLAFNTPEYCCSGALASPDKCHPTQYSQAFKTKCPQAYSYAFDDKSSTFTCKSGSNYVVTFCP